MLLAVASSPGPLSQLLNVIVLLAILYYYQTLNVKNIVCIGLTP